MPPKLVLAAGGTSPGKTTCVNALLAEVAKTPDRVILIEDTREPQCQARNYQRPKDGAASLSDLVRSSLRLHPGRIPIGEVGGEALDLLKAWGTGHPGGIGAIHARSKSCRTISTIGSEVAMRKGRVKAAGVSARRRRKPSLTPSPLRGKNDRCLTTISRKPATSKEVPPARSSTSYYR
jgi:Flp pilus assembly CpaF family ATPase